MLRRAVLLSVAVSLFAGTALAGSDPNDPQKRYNAADQARARRITIKRSDLPGSGWKAEKSSDDSNCRTFNPDESDLVVTGEFDSPDFSRSGSLVSGGSAVYRTEAQAQASWKRQMRTEGLKCLTEGAKEASKNGVRVIVNSMGRMAYPKLAPRTDAFQARLTYIVSGVRVKATLHLIGLGSGRVNVGLMTMSIGAPLKPLPAGLEPRLARLLAQRLRG